MNQETIIKVLESKDNQITELKVALHNNDAEVKYQTARADGYEKRYEESVLKESHYLNEIDDHKERIKILRASTIILLFTTIISLICLFIQNNE